MIVHFYFTGLVKHLVADKVFFCILLKLFYRLIIRQLRATSLLLRPFYRRRSSKSNTVWFNLERRCMDWLKKEGVPVLLASLWIGVSEFLRNEIFFKTYWTNHYLSLGLKFPSDPINGAIWGVWSVFLAILIYVLTSRFSLFQAWLIAWFGGFVLMWIVIGNMGVLPSGILYFAIPWSLLEVLGGALIIRKLAK